MFFTHTLKQILKELQRMSVETDALNAKVAEVATSVAAAVDELKTLTAGKVDPAVIASVTASLDASKAALDAAVAAAKA